MERMQRALKAVAAGGDPGRMLEEALAGAVAASGAAGGVIVATVGGRPKMLAADGPYAGAGIAMETAEAALANGRLTRRRFRNDSLLAAAQPVRSDGRVVAAVAVAGSPADVDTTSLPLFADVVALILGRLPTGTLTPNLGPSAGDVLVTLAEVASPVDRDGVLVRALAGCERLFRAVASCCALVDGDRVVIAHQRGLEAHRLIAARDDAALGSVLRSAAVQVLSPGAPEVTALGRPDAWAAVVPLVASGRRIGQLLVFVPAALDPAAKALLVAYASNVALALRGATAHRELADHEERLTALVHSVSTPVLVTDDEGRLASANGAASELFGLAGPFEAGRPLAGRLGSAELDALLDRPSGGRIEISLGSPPRTFVAVVHRMVADDGRGLGRALLLSDMSREREIDRVKSEFVAAVGRELRSPMMVVQGWASTLQRRWRGLPDERRQGALDAIERNAGQLLHLVEDLLFVSGLDDQPAALEVGEEDIGPLLDQCQGGRISVERPDHPLVVSLDRDSLEHVLSHLLDNALSCSDGPVLLEAAERDGFVEVAVTDSGPGVYSGDIPRLFEGFGIDETGLRLYLCRRLVELMGGRIWCESRLGTGSRFAFTLPVRRQQVWGDGLPAAAPDRIRASGSQGPRP